MHLYIKNLLSEICETLSWPMLIFRTGCIGNEQALILFHPERKMSSALAWIQVSGCVWMHLCVKYIWETWWWEQMRPSRWSGGLEGLTCLLWCVYLTVISQESSTCYLHGSYVDRWKTLSPQSNIQLLIQAVMLVWKKFGITKHKDIFNKTAILLFESGSSPAWLERGLWKTH